MYVIHHCIVWESCSYRIEWELWSTRRFLHKGKEILWKRYFIINVWHYQCYMPASCTRHITTLPGDKVNLVACCLCLIFLISVARTSPMTVRETLEDNMPVTKPMCFIHLRTTTCELTYGLSKVCFGAESGNLYHAVIPCTVEHGFLEHIRSKYVGNGLCYILWWNMSGTVPCV